MYRTIAVTGNGGVIIKEHAEAGVFLAFITNSSLSD